MDIYNLFFNSLVKPSIICDEIRLYKLTRQNIIEGAVFVSCLGTIISFAMGHFIIDSSEQMQELLNSNSITFLFNPFATFLFELLFIVVLIFTILIFGNLSKNNRDFEEIGKVVVWICFVSISFKIIQLFFIATLSNFYLILRVLEMIWFVWALSTAVCIIYDFKSLIMTAVTGLIVVSFVMIFFLIVILSIVQTLLGSGSINV